MNSSQIESTINELRKTFKSKVTHAREWREKQLKAVLEMLKVENDRIEAALRSDLGRCKQEAYTGDISSAIAETKETIANLVNWMKPQAVSTPMFQMKGLSSSFIQPSPLGVVLIISPWNYPINLLVVPLVGAIAAGNCVLLKPSELAPACSSLLAEIIPKYLDKNCIKLIEGGVKETTEILKHPFDHIFYTGSPQVGKVIMKAAAEHLCPVTLELGGKNPVFIDSNADLKVAAKRIIWGKTFNAGQSCLSPDYILVTKDFQEKLIDALVAEIKEFFGTDPESSQDLGRIISKNHVNRLLSYFDDVKSNDIVIGGPSTANLEKKYFPPTIVKNVSNSSKLMQDEIFGPILPIISVDSLESGLEIVNARPHPLAVYIFSSDSRYKNQVLNNTQSGTVSMNEVMTHFGQSSLPFGGVGMSGMGAYHGKKSFDTFSHFRSVLDKTVWFDSAFRYPPYSDTKLSTTKLFI